MSEVLIVMIIIFTITILIIGFTYPTYVGSVDPNTLVPINITENLNYNDLDDPDPPNPPDPNPPNNLENIPEPPILKDDNPDDENPPDLVDQYQSNKDWKPITVCKKKKRRKIRRSNINVNH